MLRKFLLLIVIPTIFFACNGQSHAQNTQSIPPIWFGPRAPIQYHPRLPWGGETDYLDLFRPGAPWQITESHISVFSLNPATMGNGQPNELKSIVSWLDSTNLPCAVWIGPLTVDPANPVSHEGFDLGGFGYGRVKLFAQLVGRISYLIMDEPMACGCLSGPGYDMPMETAAQESVAYVKAIHQFAPNAVLIDTEPTGKGFEPLERWLDVWHQVSGSPMTMIFLDMELTAPNMKPNWWSNVIEFETYAHQHGVKVGLIVNGMYADTSDEAWLGESRLNLEQIAAHNVNPDAILFDSWFHYPSHALPETDPTAFTNLIYGLCPNGFYPVGSQGVPQTSDVPANNLITDPNDVNTWAVRHFNSTDAVASGDQGSVKFSTLTVDGNDSDVAMVHLGMPMVEGAEYKLQFTARSDSDRTIHVDGIVNRGIFSNVGLYSYFHITRNWQTFSVTFNAVAIDGSHQNIPRFLLGDRTGDIWLKDISLTTVAYGAIKKWPVYQI